MASPPMRVVAPLPLDAERAALLRIEDAVAQLTHLTWKLNAVVRSEGQRESLDQVKAQLVVIERDLGWLVRRVQEQLVERWEETHHAVP